VTLGATVAGTIMGTAAYMAPEQAKGKRVDKRTDIWSWGVVLYELVTGDQLFRGEEIADTLAQVLTKQPDFERVPPRVRKLLRRCLEKDPKQRLRDIGEARYLLEEVAAPASAPSRSRLSIVASGAAIVFMLIAAELAFIHFREPAPPAPQVLQYTIDPPPKTRITNFAISPDGRYAAIIATGGRGGQMWVRPLDSLQAQALAGTEGADYPFWSPDSRYIGFFARGKLKKTSVVGGPAQTLCDAPVGRGGAWNSEGVIVFASPNGLNRVPAAGGVPNKVIEVEGAIMYPTFLPDGRRVLYEAPPGKEPGVFLSALDARPGSQGRRITSDISNPQYLPPLETSPHGYILFVRQGTLMAQPVDPESLLPAGDLFPVVEQVSLLGGAAFYRYSISRNGLILHLSGLGALRQHAMFDRTGKQLAALGGPVSTEGRVALSPDEKRMVSEHGTNIGKVDLWITELERGTESRFTLSAPGIAPVWSPDGNYVVFAATPGGVANLYRKPANQAGEDELLVRSELAMIPTDWSHDGRFIIFRRASPSNLDLFALSVNGDKKPIPLLTSEFNEVEGTVSQDGRWLAYASDESGTYEVYVQPFTPGSSKPSSGKWQVSIGGGRDPHWRGDGREMYYIAADRKMMAVAVKTNGDRFVRSTPQALFEVRFPVEGTTVSRYAVSADGKRFLMAVEPEASSEAEPLHVTVNWLAGVKK
jgi:Tol biopolymer transport system component